MGIHKNARLTPQRREEMAAKVLGDRKGQGNSYGAGWEYAYVCIVDAFRITFAGISPDEKANST